MLIIFTVKPFPLKLLMLAACRLSPVIKRVEKSQLAVLYLGPRAGELGAGNPFVLRGHGMMCLQ